MTLFLKYCPLVLVSAILTIAVLLVRRYFKRELPFWLAMVELFVLIAIPAVIVIPFALRYSHSFDAIFIFSLALFIFTWPLCIAVPDITYSMADALQKFLFESSLITPAPSSYGRARARIMEGDIEGAAREYRNYFDQNPKVPAPLFELARWYERECNYCSATFCYREIMSRFKENKIIWAEAGLRLGDLYIQYLGDSRAAVHVFNEIVNRVPDLEQGRLAQNRILQANRDS